MFYLVNMGQCQCRKGSHNINSVPISSSPSPTSSCKLTPPLQIIDLPYTLFNTVVIKKHKQLSLYHIFMTEFNKKNKQINFKKNRF